MNEIERACKYCGVPFIAKRKDAKFCSDRCKHKAFKERRQKRLLNVSLPEKTDKTNILTVREIPERRLVEESKYPLTLIPKAEKQRHGRKSEYIPYAECLSDEPEEEEEDRYFIEGIEVTKEQFEQSSPYSFKPYQSLSKPKFSDYQLSEIKKINDNLSKWIMKLLAYCNRRTIKLKHLKALLETIEGYQESFDYKFKPSGYPYENFVEKRFPSVLKRLIIQAEMGRTRDIKLQLSKEMKEEFTKVLYEMADIT